MDRTVLRNKLSNISANDARAMALQALESCASIVPTRLQDFSDTEEDDGQQQAPVFVQKLKNLVDDPEIDSAQWTDNGHSFLIREPERLSKQLIKYFKSSKLKSFVRQLHFYGFKKSGGSRYQDWVYSHKYFQDNGRLLHKLRRKTCGPDQQIKNLQLKVVGLQDSLASTQQKLGNMAMALAAMLQSQVSSSQAGGNSTQSGGGTTPRSSSFPVKRPRTSNGGQSHAQAQAQAQRNGGATIKTEPRVKQEQGRSRIPEPLLFERSLANQIGELHSGFSPFDLDEFELTDSVLYSPRTDDTSMFELEQYPMPVSHYGMNMNMIGVTA